MRLPRRNAAAQRDRQERNTAIVVYVLGTAYIALAALVVLVFVVVAVDVIF